MNSDLGIIGLATMGANLALNFVSKDIAVSVFNRTYEKTEKLIDQHRSLKTVPPDAQIEDLKDVNLHGFRDLHDFIRSLKRPRKILLLVKSGPAVDLMIEQLYPFLEEGDIIVDMGNSYYKDTIKRQERLASGKIGLLDRVIKGEQNFEVKKIHFLSCGISGGEEGALHGPSLMPSGAPEVVEELLPLLQKVAAKDFNGQPCVTNIGLGPAGHFVKMVHNGIEYAMMQGIAEIYDILRYHSCSNQQIHDIFAQMNSGALKSFLLDITVKIFETKDNLTDTNSTVKEYPEGVRIASDYLVDKIKDQASAKGTGAWTVEAAMELGEAAPTIAASVFARNLSSKSGYFAARRNTNPVPEKELTNKEIQELTEVLHMVFVGSYLQGVSIMVAADYEYKWNINLDEVMRIWQGGCIIRSQMLDGFLAKYVDVKSATGIEMPNFSFIWQNLGVAIPVIQASLNYFQALTIDREWGRRYPANLIQAQRDYFGAHTYERLDKSGSFTGGWEK